MSRVELLEVGRQATLPLSPSVHTSLDSNNVNNYHHFSRAYWVPGSALVFAALQMKKPRLKEEEVTEGHSW